MLLLVFNAERIKTQQNKPVVGKEENDDDYSPADVVYGGSIML